MFCFNTHLLMIGIYPSRYHMNVFCRYVFSWTNESLTLTSVSNTNKYATLFFSPLFFFNQFSNFLVTFPMILFLFFFFFPFASAFFKYSCCCCTSTHFDLESVSYFQLLLTKKKCLSLFFFLIIYIFVFRLLFAAGDSPGGSVDDVQLNVD